MKFSWSASASKGWSWQAGGKGSGSASKTMRAEIVAGERLSLDLPAGSLRVTGCDDTGAALEVRVRAESMEAAERVTYSVTEHAGETRVSVESPAPNGKSVADVEVNLRVPRRLALELRCGLGDVEARDVGEISVHANLGSVEIEGATARCDVHANLGAATVHLSPRWHGKSVSVRSNLGNATLAVPPEVLLDCVAWSNLGSAATTIPSAGGAPPAKVHSNLGSARIVPS